MDTFNGSVTVSAAPERPQYVFAGCPTVEPEPEKLCWLDGDGELHFAPGWYAEKVIRMLLRQK